jgi:two-component system response regulator HydG
MARILVIDDNETMREGIAFTVKRMGHEVVMAASGREGLARFEEKPADFVISDLKMEGLDGLAVLETLKQRHPEVVMMIVTGFGTVEAAVQAMKLGAFDFITKPFPNEVLRLKVQSALELIAHRQKHEKLERMNEVLREEVEHRYRPGARRGRRQTRHGRQQQGHAGRAGDHPARRARRQHRVHIYGESGTGKELVARAVHRTSRRAGGPFVKVNCGALAESLLESELFGHEKGSFTNAIKRKLGRFELADGGTIFLDEIGDIGPAIQLKLLRVLQEREIERVGGEDTVKVDVRVVSATNKDLRKLVEEGKFREDLYYRLHIVPLTLPPLRDRPEDIDQLAEHFLVKLRERTGSRATRLSDAAKAALRAYAWPGNVRELENCIEQSLVFCDGDAVECRDLPQHIAAAGKGAAGHAAHGAGGPVWDGTTPLPDFLDELEKEIHPAGLGEGRRREDARRRAAGRQAERVVLQAREVWDWVKA